MNLGSFKNFHTHDPYFSPKPGNLPTRYLVSQEPGFGFRLSERRKIRLNLAFWGKGWMRNEGNKVDKMLFLQILIRIIMSTVLSLLASKSLAISEYPPKPPNFPGALGLIASKKLREHLKAILRYQMKTRALPRYWRFWHFFLTGAFLPQAAALVRIDENPRKTPPEAGMQRKNEKQRFRCRLSSPVAQTDRGGVGGPEGGWVPRAGIYKFAPF